MMMGNKSWPEKDHFSGVSVTKNPYRAAHPSNNLPIQLTSFVGRKEEIQQVSQLLTTSRLLTLIGAGGVGKTRLGLEVASRVVGNYKHGVWLIELAAISEAELVVQEVWRTFKLHERNSAIDISSLSQKLLGRETLLVLDDCEHLVLACAELAEGLLRVCPDVHILATSRQPFGMAGETVWPVPTLSLSESIQPTAPRDLLRSEAVQLFIERAQAAQPDFQFTDASIMIIGEICDRLEGIPLAIEMAAAWVRSLSLPQIAARLKKPFQILTKGSRTAPPRQQSLQASIDWSYQILTEAEKTLFRRLAVFTGSFTLEAVESICADWDEAGVSSEERITSVENGPPGSTLYRQEILKLISQLADKSLVQVIQDVDTRYRILEIIRQYAWSKLLASQEEERFQSRFLDFYLELAHQDEADLKGFARSAWLRRLHIERDNLRSALHLSIMHNDTEKGLQLASTLGWYWFFEGYLNEGRKWLEKMLSLDDRGGAVRARALVNVAYLAMGMGDHQQAGAYAEQGLEMSRELADVQTEAFAIMVLGQIANWLGDRKAGLDYLEESLELFRVNGPKTYLALNLLVLADTRFRTGDHDRAIQLFEEGLTIQQDLEDSNGIAFALGGLGDLARIKGDYPRSASLLHQALVIHSKDEQKEGMAYNFEAQGILAASIGQDERAARLWGAADGLRKAIQLTLPPSYQSDYIQFVEKARRSLGVRAFDMAWEQGRTLLLDEAIRLTFQPEEPILPSSLATQRPASKTGMRLDGLRTETVHHDTLDLIKPLTGRETEILQLIFEGLSNREIAERLVLSPGTVKWYTGQIYAKLGVSTRTQAIARARQLGLNP
jgi:predicted ATPase/DNA-binding CsgD family transcriptional regulator